MAQKGRAGKLYVSLLWEPSWVSSQPVTLSIAVNLCVHGHCAVENPVDTGEGIPAALSI